MKQRKVTEGIDMASMKGLTTKPPIHVHLSMQHVLLEP